MRYYLIAGEASGDLHGSNLMKNLIHKDPDAKFRFWGGDLMKRVGGEIVKHYQDLAFMGFVEVLFNIRTIFRNIALCKKDILEFEPDVIVFLDYPGFNLRIAKWAKKNGFKTHYYISPQIWAWKEGRIKRIKRDVDAMYVILPFEKEFYENKHHFPVQFVGHPLIDAIAEKSLVDPAEFRKEHGLDQRPIIAILPGSRKQEIRKMLKQMVSIVQFYPDYQFVIAGAPGQDSDIYQTYIAQKNVTLLHNMTYDLLSISYAALVTSGTATLETALFKVPQVVCYKGSRISYEIAKRVINLKFISLVNLILDREVVTELIQDNFNKTTLRKELDRILDDQHRTDLFLDYYELEKKLGGKGASNKVAKLIVDAIK